MSPVPAGGRREAAGAALDAHLVELDLTLTALGRGRVDTEARPSRPWIPGRRAVHLVHRASFDDGAAREETTVVVLGRAGLWIGDRRFSYADTTAALDELTRSVVERLFAGRRKTLSDAFGRGAVAFQEIS